MKMQKVDISIIILNFNAKNFVIDCLHSIEKADWGVYKQEIIVVDNNSTDGSVQSIKNLIIEFSARGGPAYGWQLIENHENVGFSKGNNDGVPYANGRYVLFLNPDTVVNKNTFSHMIAYMDANRNVGAATCKLKLADGHIDEVTHRGFPTPWNAFCHFSGLEKIFPHSRLFSGYSLGYLSNQVVHEIDALSGAFMMVRREVGEKTNWWDEDYFWYGEDLDFCYRIKKEGFAIMYVPTVSILHYRGISSGVKKHSKEFSVATRRIRKMAADASIQAMRIFYRKHYVGKYPTPVLWLVWIGIWILEKYRMLFW